MSRGNLQMRAVRTLPKQHAQDLWYSLLYCGTPAYMAGDPEAMLVR